MLDRIFWTAAAVDDVVDEEDNDEDEDSDDGGDGDEDEAEEKERVDGAEKEDVLSWLLCVE